MAIKKKAPPMPSKTVKTSTATIMRVRQQGGLMMLATADVVVNKRKRIRLDLGNVAEMADSIKTIGQIQPIVVNRQTNELIVGGRRLAACKMLERTVMALLVDPQAPNEAQQALDAWDVETSENTCRKDLTPQEKARAYDTRIVLERAAAKARQVEGGRNGGGDRRSAKAKSSGGPRPTRRSEEKEANLASTRAAKAVGFSSRREAERVKAVVEAAKAEPKKYGDLLDTMNRTGKVSGVAKRVKVRKQAEALNKEAKRASAKASKTGDLPKGPFRVACVDPPWHYDKREEDVTQRGKLDYPTMSIEQITALPIESIMHADSILWLWTTNSHIEHAFSIARGWGFVPKTVLTWVKDKMGTGDWLRGKTEHCLMCVRGKPTIVLTNETTELRAPVGEHSAKPEAFYRMVDKLCPGSKVEIFSRTNRKGWVSYGDEVGTLG